MESVFLSELHQTNGIALGSILKAAYLTTQRVAVFGPASGMVMDWNSFKTESPRLKREILLSSSFGEVSESAKDIYKVFDSLKGKKYLDAKQLKLKAIGESLLKDLEQVHIDGMNSYISKFRLSFYSELKKEGEPLCEALTLKDEPGDAPFEKDSLSQAMILRFELPGETPDVFWLEPEFFDPNYQFDMEWFSHPSEFNTNGDAAQLLPLFDLPSVSDLTATETKYLKQNIKAEADAWNDAMDPFLDYYLRKKGAAPDADTLEGIVQKSKALNEAIARSPLLSASRENADSIFYHPFQIILAFLPTPMLWKFYETHNEVSDITMKMLEQFKNDPQYISHQPVFLVKSKREDYFNSDAHAGKTFVPTESKAVKKSIEI